MAITGELKKWHKVTLSFNGPDTSEDATPNPFLDYRLNVTFSKGSKRYTVPGYYAADGSASETGAAGGNKWRVHFTPDEVGTWTYKVSFRSGPGIAASNSPNAGSSESFDKLEGTLKVAPSDKTGRDHRGKGMLRYIGGRYLQFAESGEYFIKGGADSPENLLGYVDFDGTFDLASLYREGEAEGERFLHAYAPHQRDWRPGDPTWKNGKGKNIIGALNYLASKGMNSVYFITYNIDGGDGKDVWPWTSPDERYRFDCSKLDQWEIVFSHMDRLGLMLHVITQETENDQDLDGGIDPRKDQDLPWAAMSYGLNERCYSVQHMNHPGNPQPTVYSAYRDYGRFGAFFKKKIGSRETLALRYRILVVEGDMPARKELAGNYSVFVDGPKVEVVSSK